MTAGFGREWLGLVLRLRTISSGSLGTISGESWSVERLHALHDHYALPVDLFDSVSRTPMLWGEKDSMRWNLTSTGEFSLTSAWDQVIVPSYSSSVSLSVLYRSAGTTSPSSSSFGWEAPSAALVELLPSDLQMAAGGGGLVRDHTGSLLASFCAPLRAASSFDTEFQALLHGLRLAGQYSDHVWIEMDAASVVLVL
ncbi:hypothetical protein C2S52_001167 [Perilla frutescens var. hirtella]|nr:hypothetical protein C2S52_001167 [Perilla frutescens var. hirtella]